MNNNYTKAYTEVLEIIKYLPKEEYEKIPEEKIKFYKENCDKDYNFKFDISKPLNEQDFLKETNIIIVILFRDYFATVDQKESLQKILILNEAKKQEELRKKYNPDNIFNKEKQVKIEDNDSIKQTELIEVKQENIVKEIFNKIIKWIKDKFKR